MSGEAGAILRDNFEELIGCGGVREFETDAPRACEVRSERLRRTGPRDASAARIDAAFGERSWKVVACSRIAQAV